MLTYTVNVIQLQACVSRQVFIVYIQNTMYLFIIIYLKKKKFSFLVSRVAITAVHSVG